MSLPKGFRYAQPEDKERIFKFTRNMGGQLSCEYAFANLLSWGELYQISFKIEDEQLWVYNGTEDYLYFPLGAHDVSVQQLHVRSLEMIAEGFSGVLDQVPRTFYEANKLQINSLFCYEQDDRFLDYVYSIDTLADLPGEFLSKKRNLCTQFEKLYPNWRVEPLDGRHGVPSWLIPFIAKWSQAASNSAGSIEEDVEALQQVFSYFESGGHFGLVLYVGDEIVGFTIWSQPTDLMSITHFEKALRAFKGASQMINRECARYLRENSGVKWINREQDLGVDGLRQAKRSYLPAYQIEVGFLKPKI